MIISFFLGNFWLFFLSHNEAALKDFSRNVQLTKNHTINVGQSECLRAHLGSGTCALSRTWWRRCLEGWTLSPTCRDGTIQKLSHFSTSCWLLQTPTSVPLEWPIINNRVVALINGPVSKMWNWGGVEGGVKEEASPHLVEKANVSSMKLSWMAKTAEKERIWKFTLYVLILHFGETLCVLIEFILSTWHLGLTQRLIIEFKMFIF